jgi:aromatic ring-cleaving dioxygenase
MECPRQVICRESQKVFFDTKTTALKAGRLRMRLAERAAEFEVSLGQENEKDAFTL